MLVGVLGPTASGKTEVAEALARFASGLLLSADAFQAYRGFDVGTAKPGNKHDYALVDILEPDEPFGVGEWVSRAAVFLRNAWQARRSAVVVGGTGLYVRALFEGYTDMAPAPDPVLRARLGVRLREEGLEALSSELARRDPVTAARTDLKNPVRVRRALERLDTPERSVRVDLPPFHKLKFVLLPDREAHDAWIEERLDAMLSAGWIEEVRTLLARGVRRDAPAMRAIGYRHIAAFLTGVMSFDEARAQILADTRRYAKRQRTWLRKEPGRIEVSGYRNVREAISESLRLLELQVNLGGTYG